VCGTLQIIEVPAGPVTKTPCKIVTVLIQDGHAKLSALHNESWYNYFCDSDGNLDRVSRDLKTRVGG
jgi:hypothetical protein